MTTPHTPAHIRAVRSGQTWTTQPGEHGVIVSARTLQRLAEQAGTALELRYGRAPGVQITASSAEIDALNAARDAYEAALRAAVRRLRADRATWRDISQACGINQTTAKQIMSD